MRLCNLKLFMEQRDAELLQSFFYTMWVDAEMVIIDHLLKRAGKQEGQTAFNGKIWKEFVFKV